MIIVISPSKTYQTAIQAPLRLEEPRFMKEAEVLRKQISDWTREEFKQRMKLSDALTDQVAAIYQGKIEESGTAAIAYYTGLVYKQLCLSVYDEAEWVYIKDHLRILSAMYGVLKPQDRVKPYRLDFLVKWPERNLYRYWEALLRDYWGGETLVDLSSNEFGKMLPKERIQIQFLQLNKRGEWKSQSTKTKMARGRMLNWLIQEQIKTPEDIQAFALDGYRFDAAKSTESVWFFLLEENEKK